MKEELKQIWSQALNEETERRYGMSKHHPAEDCPPWFIDQILEAILSKIVIKRKDTMLSSLKKNNEVEFVQNVGWNLCIDQLEEIKNKLRKQYE